MKNRIIIIILFMLTAGGAARAMLPPDASEREPQLRRERVAADRKYEEFIIEHRAAAIQRHKDVTAGLDYPPWKCGPSGAPKPGATLSKRTRSMTEVTGHSWLVGISCLLVIGGLFFVIKQMTPEADNR